MRRPNFQGIIRFGTAFISLCIMCYVYLPSRSLNSPETTETPPSTSAPTDLNRGSETPPENMQPIKHPVRDQWDVLNFVNGAPKESLYDNLRNDTKYITSFLSAGWTNDVMSFVNTIYLAILTGRVAVMAPFLPVHVGQTTELPFGDVFDIPRLRELINHPVIDWRDVKYGHTSENLGCWTLWWSRNGNPRGSNHEYTLGLDISYTKVPERTEMMNQHNTFWGLAKLAFPEGREEALRNVTVWPSGWHHHKQLPDDRMMCFDILYYVCVYDPFEWDRDYTPAWRFVGTHLHFHPDMTRLAEFYIRKSFGLPQTATIPPFVSIHIRHGDFRDYCNHNTKTCFAPISVIAESVSSIRAQLLTEKGVDIHPNHVIMTSDEKDPKWWAEIKQQGWSYVDHKSERTTEDLGRWYPTLIDAVIQSMGTGFVGTDGSTMSMVAKRRVVDWNDGLGVMVKFGANMYPDQLTTSKTAA